MKSTRRVKNETGKDPSTLARTTSVNSVRSTGDANEASEPGKHSKVMLKPADQVQLTELEMNEEFTRILNANNPKAAQNIARYNFKEKIYKATPNVEHHVIHFDYDGYLVYKGDDSKREEDGLMMMASAAAATSAASAAATGAPDEGALIVEEVNEEGEVVTKTIKKNTVNKNQFNFSDRATQTINHSHKERSTNTEPPPQKLFSASVTQWEIYDAYVDDEIAKEKAAKEKSKSSGQAGTAGGKGNNAGSGSGASGAHSGAKESGAGSAASGSGSGNDDNTGRMTLLPTEVHNDDIINRPEFYKSAKILERMANQNTYDDVAQDYKYWEDASDEFREGKGTLLPLWTFHCEVDKRKQVTALVWSPFYADMFLVGYGSYDFLKQGPGLIACFSLKNPSYPEILYQTDAGVMSLDLHREHPNLMAVGMYDGSVAVYDLSQMHRKVTGVNGAATGAGGVSGAASGAGTGGAGGGGAGGASGASGSSGQASSSGAGGMASGASASALGLFNPLLPLYKSGAKSGKHLDPVWQVLWGNDDLDGHLNFCSVSSDGRICQWTLLKNELVCSDVINLKLMEGGGEIGSNPGGSKTPRASPPSSAGKAASISNSVSALVSSTASNTTSSMFGLAAGTCFSFHPTIEHLFVVGTEEGHLHYCSKNYHNDYLSTLQGHQMSIYAVKFNPFNGKVVLSAGADWTVRLWDLAPDNTAALAAAASGNAPAAASGSGAPGSSNSSQPRCVLSFDLNSPVGDIAWAPFSSTIFAACTADGKVVVYDLNENKYEPICEQFIVRKAKLTHISFNPRAYYPILLAGDDKGTVVSLKLSPNLRKKRRANDETPENERIEKILAVASGVSR